MQVSLDTIKRVRKRERLAKSLGMQMGTLYMRHVEKFQVSSGYVRDGNLRHFVACNRKRRIHVKGQIGEY